MVIARRRDDRLSIALFNGDDVPELAKVSGQTLIPQVTHRDVASWLNNAFEDAYVAAEVTTLWMDPGGQDRLLKQIESAGRRLLRGLGMSDDPRAYSRDYIRDEFDLEDLFRKSPVGARIGDAITQIEPIDFFDPNRPGGYGPWWYADLERSRNQEWEAEKQIPLSDHMVPTSIADRAMPWLSKGWMLGLAEEEATETGEDVNTVASDSVARLLLRQLPSSIAFLLALIGIAPRAMPNDEKANYTRTFRTRLFKELVGVHRDAFGCFPKSSDSDRDPENGTGTLWVHRVIQMAAGRPDRIKAGRPSRVVSDRQERQRLVNEIKATAGMALAGKAARIIEVVRMHRRQLGGVT